MNNKTVTRRYIVSVDGESTTKQRNLFTNYLTEQKVGYWHHLNCTWVIVDTHGKFSSSDFRKKLMEIMPNVSTITIEVNINGYAGFAPESSHKWLEEYLR